MHAAHVALLDTIQHVMSPRSPESNELDANPWIMEQRPLVLLETVQQSNSGRIQVAP